MPLHLGLLGQCPALSSPAAAPHLQQGESPAGAPGEGSNAFWSSLAKLMHMLAAHLPHTHALQDCFPISCHAGLQSLTETSSLQQGGFVGKQTLEGHLKALEAAVAEGQHEVATRLHKMGLQLQLLQEGAVALAQVDMVSTAGCHRLLACCEHLGTVQNARYGGFFVVIHLRALGVTQLPAFLGLFPDSTALMQSPSHELQDASQLQKAVAKKADREAVEQELRHLQTLMSSKANAEAVEHALSRKLDIRAYLATSARDGSAHVKAAASTISPQYSSPPSHKGAHSGTSVPTKASLLRESTRRSRAT